MKAIIICLVGMMMCVPCAFSGDGYDSYTLHKIVINDDLSSWGVGEKLRQAIDRDTGATTAMIEVTRESDGKVVLSLCLREQLFVDCGSFSPEDDGVRTMLPDYPSVNR